MQACSVINLSRSPEVRVELILVAERGLLLVRYLVEDQINVHLL